MANHNATTEAPADPMGDLYAFIHRSTVGAMTARHGGEKGKEAAVKVFAAIRNAISTAKNPFNFASCTDQSILNCINQSIDLDLYPGGPNPNVYLVPQSPRKGEPMEMQWRITHRGLATLAARAGYALAAVPVAKGDHIEVDMGDVVSHRPADLSRSPTMGTLLGFIVIIKRQRDGVAPTRAWVPADVITARKDKARDQSIWQAWPMEMSAKTAIKYVFARGIAVIESLDAIIAADTAAEIEEAAQTVEVTRRTVAMPAPAIAGPAPLPESRQLAAPAIEEAEWSPPADPIHVATTQPAPTQTTRSAPTPPPWLSANRERIAALAAAMSRPAGTVG
ncbi:MAG: recombinase RecT, partial [Ilumatobacteraceae bacterium]